MIGEVVREERERLLQYQKLFRVEPVDFCNRSVLIVDDGLATGRTMQAAVMAARRKGAKQTMVAVPVSSASAIELLEGVTNGVFALVVDPDFEAVGAYYQSFPQTSDEEVVGVLRAERAHH